MKTNIQQQGFSLVEVLVAMVAASILVLTTIAILGGPLRTLKKNNEFAEIRRDLAYAVAVISKELRVANYDDLLNAWTQSDSLIIPINDSRHAESQFQLSGGTIEHYENGARLDDLILDNVRLFNNSITNDLSSGLKGVVMQITMQNPDGTIEVTHESFVHTRN